jgi:hypothetical protein
MGTRGLYGYIKKSGEYTAQYNNSDSYPDGLGLDFYKACIGNKLNDYKVTDENIDFIKQSLFCEWAYFYDKKNKIFEIWRGFQEEKDLNNPFGKQAIDSYYPCKRILRVKIADINEKLFTDYPDYDEFERVCNKYNRESKLKELLD